MHALSMRLRALLVASTLALPAQLAMSQGCVGDTRTDAAIADARVARADVYAPTLLKQAEDALANGENRKARELADQAREEALFVAGKARRAAEENARLMQPSLANSAGASSTGADVELPFGVEAVEAKDVPALIADGALLLDVRPDSALLPGPNDGPHAPRAPRIPDATRAPRTTLKGAQYPTNKALIVVGDGRSMHDAGYILFHERGYKRVLAVKDGVDGWRAAGLPVELAASTTTTAANENIEPITPAELGKLRDTRNDLIIVDARSRDLFDSGHLPGATNVPEPDLAHGLAGGYGNWRFPVVYGIDSEGSRRAAEKLASALQKRVLYVEGGVVALATSGAALDTSTTVETSNAIKPTVNAQEVAQ